MSPFAILLALGLPVVLAMVLTMPRAAPMVWRLMPIAPLPALAVALLGAPGQSVTGTWLILGSSFGLDAVAQVFLGFTALLWIAASASARQWMKGDAHATSFGACFLLAMAGNLGLLLAQDALSFYAFFALMSFASYGLVLHARKPESYGAARLYIGFVVAGELALFAGLALAVAQAGSFLLVDMRSAQISDLAAGLMVAGFGVKLGLMPLHFWLPPAHGSAPVPASAVLSGVMIKAGLFGMLSALPLGMQDFADLGTVVLAASLVTIFAAAILGVQETNPKAVLGYSSVSQMGLVGLGLGSALLVPAAMGTLLPVLVFLAAHHALAKGALFLGVGAYGAQTGRAGRVAVALALVVPALVLAGLPATSGALAKEALKDALVAGSPVWLPWLLVALTLSGIATTCLMARFGWLMATRAPAAPPRAEPEGLVLPFAGLGVAAVVLPMIWPMLGGAFAPVLDGLKPGDLWPLGAGLALAAAVALRAHAMAIGVDAFARQIAAPFVTASQQADQWMNRTSHALWRRARVIPARLGQQASDLRLGQTAIAGLIVLVMALELARPQMADATTEPEFVPALTSPATQDVTGG